MNLYTSLNSLSETDPSTILCLACGFCCNGVLHTYTRLTASEVVSLQLPGTSIYAIPNTPYFAFDQPCSFWQANHCTIYSQRPESCRLYECLLYKKLAAGLTGPVESLARLKKAQNLLAQSNTPNPTPNRLAARLRSCLERHFEPDSLTR